MKQYKTIPFDLDLYNKGDYHRLKTHGNHPVRILCTDRETETRPIVGLVSRRGENYESVISYTKQGKMYNSSDTTVYDLWLEVEVPERYYYHEGTKDYNIFDRNNPSSDVLPRYMGAICFKADAELVVAALNAYEEAREKS